MAWLDERNEFADAVSVANAAATINVGDTIDSTVARDLGNGAPIYLVVSVDTEIITGGSAGTIQFQLVSDSTAVPSTDGSQAIHAISEEYVTDGTDANDAELKAGQYPFVVALPWQGQQYERYLGVQAIIGTTTTTAGNVNAFLTFDPPRNVSYPDAVN